MLKKITAIALLVASTGAAALPQGQQETAITYLSSFGLTPHEAVAVQQLRAEEQRIVVLLAEASALQGVVDYYQGEVDRMQAQLAANNELLRWVVPLNNSRPQGSPVWSQDRWQNWDRNRNLTWVWPGRGSKNTLADEARIQAENDEIRELLPIAEAEVTANTGSITERLAEVSAIEMRTGYAGTSSYSGNACIQFHGPMHWTSSCYGQDL